MPQTTPQKPARGEPVWLGPNTHGWPDLPERDLPANQRKPVKGRKP
jgi:hypothetical protein